MLAVTPITIIDSKKTCTHIALKEVKTKASWMNRMTLQE
jgi:hypothetical protein